MDYEKWEIFNLEKKLKFLCDDAERERERDYENKMCPALERKQIDRAHGKKKKKDFITLAPCWTGVFCVGDCTPKDEAIRVTGLMCGVDKEIGTY
jgi:hypothetical protein